MNKKYIISMSPHITNNRTTKRIMADVIIALIPTIIASIFIFGFYSLVNIAICIVSALAAETIFNKIVKQKNSIGDLSAVVTAIILALNLPPIMPIYMPIIGTFFAIIVVKMLFGGIGKNFANPAITARIFMVLAWAGAMSAFVQPIDLSNGFGEMFKYFSAFGKNGYIDTISTATPLSFLKVKDYSSISNLNLFLGVHGGTTGEVSAIALLIGGVYLAIRRVIDIKIPLIYIGSVVVLTLIFRQNVKEILPTILGGGLLFGAIFMATDYSSSPNSFWAVVVYSLLLGLFTTLFRQFSAMNEGVSFAILLSNLLVPMLDKYIRPRPFGYIKKKKEKKDKKGADKNA